MIRIAAVLWLAVVALAGGYLVQRLHHGLAFRTDLMALLPREQQDPTIQHANDTVTRALSQRVLLLVGGADRARARDAAAELTRQLTATGLVEITTSGFDKDRLQRLGALYFPYRRGLLAEDDRRRLLDGKGGEVALRALSQVFGFVGMADARLVQRDPFLLMPGFFASLPLPLSKLTLDDGMLSMSDGGTTWVLIAGRLTDEPYALDVQRRLIGPLDEAVDRLGPGLEVLRLGAVFFAKAGAEQAMSETSSIGVASTLGTVLLVLVAFRALAPLWLSLLVIGVGVMTALSASLWAFGELHVGALLFGVSLIGVAVDYSLQYCSEIFASDDAPPRNRLRRVLMGITLGTATTVIGYLTLFLAPFPGLHQIAAFSAVGLVAAWLTVVLWLPLLDRSKPPRHGAGMLAAAAGFLALWENPRHHRARVAVLGLLAVIGVAGLIRLHADDDVRRMQSLSAGLVAQQQRIQSLIGSTGGTQFFLIQAPDDETALQREEQLIARLRPLVGQGALSGFQAPAQYVPSAARQRENRALVHAQLDGTLLDEQVRQLGLSQAPAAADDSGPVLTLAEARGAGGPLSFLSMLLLDGTAGETLHVVTLDHATRLDLLAQAAEGLPGVRLVDPAGDFSALLAKYRNRAMLLLALSAALMAPLLAWRYGIKRGLWVMLPPSLAVVLAPAVRALAGGAFTFFDAMALVLVLSVGVDYAVFCAETSGSRKPVTMLAVAMAACTALMSFGLLALSDVLAVRHFGSTMLVGILLAFLLAPLARSGMGSVR